MTAATRPPATTRSCRSSTMTTGVPGRRQGRAPTTLHGHRLIGEDALFPQEMSTIYIYVVNFLYWNLKFFSLLIGYIILLIYYFPEIDSIIEFLFSFLFLLNKRFFSKILQYILYVSNHLCVSYCLIFRLFCHYRYYLKY